MLDVNGLKQKLIEAIEADTFPESGPLLTSAIVSYLQESGTPLPPTISYTLSPATGSNWANLISKASDSGVADYIISDVIALEFAGSTKVVPGPEGVMIVPMSFNTGAKVSDLKEVNDYIETWEKVAKAIIDFFSTEIN